MSTDVILKSTRVIDLDTIELDELIKNAVRQGITEAHPNQQREEKEPLTIDEAAVFTGLCKSTLYKLSHLREIPVHRPRNGRSDFFPVRTYGHGSGQAKNPPTPKFPRL